MFRFVNKSELWKIEDSGVLKALAPANFGWHLKNIQDAIAFEHLRRCSGLQIAEIGGGYSRVLPAVASKNSCYNIEKFEGAGGGPNQPIEIPEIKRIEAYIGDSQGIIADESFDVIFSISVIEHVDENLMDKFWADCARISKPGALMLHLIDVYLTDGPPPKPLEERLNAYRIAFDQGYFTPADPAQVLNPPDTRFSCAFATNPDNVMQNWNRLAPSLRMKREKSQCCSLVMLGKKSGS